MFRENILTRIGARLARIPFALRRQQFQPPQKALILQPCCLSQVMLATPLLAVLSEAYPEARFDWAVSDWARSGIASNPRLTELISTGAGIPRDLSWNELQRLIGRLRAEAYDTCFVPSRSSLLSYVAWQAGIPQRVGLNVDGRGFAYTVAVKPPEGEQHAASIYLSLAAACGLDEAFIASAGCEFYPPDRDRTNITRRLVEEVDWLGDVPLVLMHPGGGENPLETESLKRWPVERFVVLGNHLARKYRARAVLVGTATERPLANAISGMMATKVANLAGELTLGELAAMTEVADLYVGGDTGPTHVAAATGCPTLAIFGPSNPTYSRPYGVQADVSVLWRDLSEVEEERPFTWDIGVTAEQAIAAADELLARRAMDEESGLRFLADLS